MNGLIFVLGGALFATLLLVVETQTENYSLGLERPEKQEEIDRPFDDMDDGIECAEQKEWDYDVDDV